MEPPYGSLSERQAKLIKERQCFDADVKRLVDASTPLTVCFEQGISISCPTSVRPTLKVLVTGQPQWDDGKGNPEIGSLPIRLCEDFEFPTGQAKGDCKAKLVLVLRSMGQTNAVLEELQLFDVYVRPWALWKAFLTPAQAQFTHPALKAFDSTRNIRIELHIDTIIAALRPARL